MTSVGSRRRPPAVDQPPAGFAEFYRSTAPLALSRIRGLACDEQRAQDATQEAYARMLERWPERCTRSRVDNLNYTVAIARNLVTDWYRDSRRTGELDDELPGDGDDASIVAVLDKLSLFKTVRTFIDGLPSRRRAVAVLYFMEELSNREIAEALGIAESTVRTQVERVRVSLAPYLERIAQLERGGAS